MARATYEHAAIGSTGSMHTPIDLAFLELAATQHWLIGRPQALALGLSRHAIDRRLASGMLVPMYSCVYRVAAAPQSWHQRLLAACMWTSGVASHRAALIVLGIEGYVGDIVEVTTTATKKTSTESVRVHRLECLSPCDATRVGPIPTTTATRTLVEVGSVLPQKRLEEALDSALRQRLTSVDRLRAGVERLGGRGRPGPSALSKVLDARGNACPTDSALETRLGRLLRRHRLPKPERQVMVRDEDGLVGRIDFAYIEQRIAIEVQSYRWHSSRAAWRKDMERLNRLQRLGWIVIQVTFEDLERRPATIASRIREALESRSA